MRTSNKTYKVVILPTEKASNMIIDFDHQLQYHHKDSIIIHNYNNTRHLNPDVKALREGYSFMELYIISDDEIKEGDWFTYNLGYSIMKCTGFEDTLIIGMGKHHKSICKKIIATTDKSLVLGKNKGKSLLGTDLNEYLPQIPESFIKAYIEAHNNKKAIAEVDLEMDYDLGIPIDEPENRFNYRLKTRPDNTVIIHISKTYTRAEVEKLLIIFAMEDAYSLPLNRSDRKEYMNKWIQENL